MAPLAILLAVVGIVALLARWRRNSLACFLCLAIFSPLLITVNLRALEIVFDAKSGRRIAGQLAALSPETELACLECFPNGLPFYLRRTATLISRDGGELKSNYIISTLEKAREWPRQIVRRSDFESWLASRKSPVYLIVRQEERDKLEKLAGPSGAAVQTLSSQFYGAQLPAPAVR